MEKKLYRDEHRKKIGGVCAGLAEYFDVDVSIIRVIFLVTFILKGAGGLVYVILWIVLPKKPYVYNPDVDYRVPPQDPANPFKDGPMPGFTMPGYDKTGKPFGKVPVKKSSNVGPILGAILIIIGGALLLENFNLIPDIDFHVMWPMVLVGIGIVFIVTSTKKQPWEKADWHKNGPDANDTTAESNDTTNNNPPTV